MLFVKSENGPDFFANVIDEAADGITVRDTNVRSSPCKKPRSRFDVWLDRDPLRWNTVAEIE